jgi:hypothetical protein
MSRVGFSEFPAKANSSIVGKEVLGLGLDLIQPTNQKNGLTDVPEKN